MTMPLSYLIPAVFLAIVGCISCKKELSCEGCIGDTGPVAINKPPTASAGPDQSIILPKDSVFLDGTTSSDPDGTITSYKWAKITWPGSANIAKPDSSKTIVNSLAAGVYQFELTVTDNGGLSAKDTVQVMVDNPAVNQPPVACAGADQLITLPTNSITLNGSCSSDPENNITAYAWTKIAGPSSFNIASANAAQTQVTNLAEGIYHFELIVTDAGNLSSKDTIQVTVNAAIVAITCGDTNRTRINASLIQVGTLSLPRTFMAVASVGNKILFAGGSYGLTQTFYSRVDIYNLTTNTWSTAELSIPRFSIGAVAAGNKIFFAGGDGSDGAFPLTNVDVYDASANSWSLMYLSNRNQGIAAATVGNKVLFAGGEYPSRIVQIFNLTTNTWSTQSIGFDVRAATAVTVNNKVYYGGSGNQHIIIYDNNTNTWSTKTLNESRYHVAGINVGDKIYWAGGVDYNGGLPYNLCSVEVQDVNTGNITMQNLSSPKAFWSVNGQNAVLKNNKIIFYKSNSYTLSPSSIGEFDIYDITTGTWSIGVLPFPLEDASIISVNNTIYLAGGLVNGVVSDKVYTLEF